LLCRQNGNIRWYAAWGYRVSIVLDLALVDSNFAKRTLCYYQGMVHGAQRQIQLMNGILAIVNHRTGMGFPKVLSMEKERPGMVADDI